ncbi:MAG: 30S ribosomal protein S12 methylthiotransferase RimO [Myxococcales bacterium FL481]|nr:MAG: 30S ribosomal protein S12 methylthiotransferase RimO [Myxococcales bacterium FL481]
MSSATDSPSRRVYFVSLGCPKNQVDTEVMLGVARDEGCELVDDASQADTLVVNTCGFIDAAKEESIETILELAEIKRQSEGAKLVVTGCLSQRYAGQLATEMPEVDHFLGSSDMLALRDIVRGSRRRQQVSELDRRAYLYDHAAPRVLVGQPHRAYIKIAEGCDRPCAFCIIPKLRGPQRSRTVESVVAEATELVGRGVREICLVGQDLTTYGTDLQRRGFAPADFEDLLDGLCGVPGLAWIRLHYAFPTTTSAGVLDRIATHPKIASYLDVPLQHVDTEVLRRMRRGYTERQVQTLVDEVRSRSPKIWLRTTMLVGHPGETEAAFRRLADFIGDGAIDHLGVFPWSREEGTPSAMLPARVTEDVAEARAAEIMTIQEEIRRERFRSMIGSTMQVMIDGASDESEYLLDARHEGQAPEIDGKVVVCDLSAAPGEMHAVRILNASAHDLVASADLDRSSLDD